MILNSEIESQSIPVDDPWHMTLVVDQSFFISRHVCVVYTCKHDYL